MLALLACDGAKPDAAGALQVSARPADGRWPAGTVLAVDDLPISADEVDLVTPWVQRIEDMRSDSHLRRVAFSRQVLPRAIAALEYPRERAAALEQARARQAELAAGRLAGPADAKGALGERVEGGFKELGLVVWGTLLDLPDGSWSEVLEEPGRFVVARRLERRDAPVPKAVELVIDAFVFRFVPEGRTLTHSSETWSRHRLTIVDPAWRTIVPELVQFHMRAERTP